MRFFVYISHQYNSLKAWWGPVAKKVLLAGGSAMLIASVHSRELTSHRQIWENSALA